MLDRKEVEDRMQTVKSRELGVGSKETSQKCALLNPDYGGKGKFKGGIVIASEAKQSRLSSFREEELQGEREIMLEALELASRGKGKVEPNPMAGALIIKEGRVVGRGYHQVFGGNHAEVNAINEAREAASGAIMYVTLEPCVHFGKTPPCTKAIIAAGIERVIVAAIDPNPQVSGKGVEELRRAGIEVELGLCREEARRLNAPYFKFQERGLPYFIAKWAMTLDGKIATASGESKWITGEEARSLVHLLRGEVEGVMIGINSVLKDDPLLTCRIEGGRNPRRIVVDSRLRLPIESRIVQTARESEVLVATTASAPPERREAIEKAGCKVMILPAKEGKVDVLELARSLRSIPLRSILIEGGSKLLGSMFEARLIDKVEVFIAPKLLGGKEAKGPIGGKGIAKILEAVSLSGVKVERIGEDLFIEGYIEEKS